MAERTFDSYPQVTGMQGGGDKEDKHLYFCTVSLGHVSAVEMHADEGITALVIDSIDILNRHTEEGYVKFIITILDVLELFLRPIVDSDDILCNTPPNPFMNPTRGVMGFHVSLKLISPAYTEEKMLRLLKICSQRCTRCMKKGT